MTEALRAPRPSRRELVAVACVTVAPLLPFLSAAVSLDGPVFFAMARRILEAPLDPYGFEMIWDSTSTDAARFNRNPPLLSYYLAPWMRAFGESEIPLHAAMLVFPLTASLSFYGIARRLAGEGLAPAALLVTTPAFLVLATTFLLDVPVLAFMLLAVYGLLRSAEAGRTGAAWAAAAGLAAAAAGLTKYVGLSIAPLLAAGALLLRLRPSRTAGLVAVPLLVWTLWGVATAHAYGTAHLLQATDVVADKSFEADHFLNKVLSAPLYYGAALVFPIFVWARCLLRPGPGTELAVLGVVLGAATVAWVLPEGEPPRRVPLGADESVLGALGFAGGFTLWSLLLDPRRLRSGPVDRLLWLWLGGLLAFTAVVNWHVNAADALLAAPPALLLWFRCARLRPSGRATAIWLAAVLPLSMGLAWAEAKQSNFYRSAAAWIDAEIGPQTGSRYFEGHWGLQHYLEQRGFEPIVPPVFGRAELERGDWVVSARNVSQLDVHQSMNPYAIRPVWTWKLESRLPLRTTNGDAGTGFYSHHSGYVPFGWSDEPFEVITLGRVVGRRSR